MSDARAPIDQELGQAIGAYFDRAVEPIDPVRIADGLGVNRRGTATGLDLRRALVLTAAVALMLFAGYRAVVFVGSLLERSDKPEPFSEAVIVVASGSQIHVFRAVDGTASVKLDVAANPACASVSPDGSIITYSHGENRGTLSLARPDGTLIADLEGEYEVQAPSWTADGALFVAVRDTSRGFAHQSTELWLHARDGSPLRRLSSGGPFLHAAISPDGEWVAILDDGSLVIMNRNGDVRDRADHPGRMASAQSPAWSPDGTRVAYSLGPGPGRTLYVFDFDSQTNSLLNSTDEAYFPQWSPDGQTLAVALMDSLRLGLVDADTGAVRSLDIDAGGEHAWSPDGQRLAVNTLTGQLTVIGIDGGLVWNRSLPSTPDHYACALAWPAGIGSNGATND